MRSQPGRLARLAFAYVGALALGAAAVFGLSSAAASPGAEPPPAAPPAPAPAAPPAPAPAPAAPPASVGLASATSLQEAFASVAERVSPSVVRVDVEARTDLPAHPFGLVPFGGAAPGITRGGGSGVIVSTDGYVLTNRHVIERASRVEVHLHDGRRFPARVVGDDPATDLAVLKIEATGLRAATFGSSDAARVGQWVVAIGSPFGLDYTVTTGVLSAKGRGGLGANEIEDYLQTDASINPGNSGGPLVDLEGRVLGINTMIIGRGTGIGFAVPSDLARHVAAQIMDGGAVRRAWLGVGFQELTPELAGHFGGLAGGALVSSVVPGGPAARAGIRPGDVVLAVDGAPVREGHDLLRAVLRKPVGERVTVTLQREGRSLSVPVVTGERPGAEPPRAERRPEEPDTRGARLGLSLQTLSPERGARLGYRGEGRVLVSGVTPGSPADRAGLRPGDVVLEADRRAVQSAEELERALADGAALLRVEREGGFLYAALSADG